jgi:hypothetical protein
MNETNLKSRLMRHLDSCLKEIDTEVFTSAGSTLVVNKEHDDNHPEENFGIMKETNTMKPSTRDDNVHEKHFNTTSVALNLSLNSTAIASMSTSSSTVNDQDENNNGTDDNTFESSSSFPSITSEQQPLPFHNLTIETTSCMSSSLKRTKNNDKRNEKTDESISIGLTPSKKPRPRSNEKYIKAVILLLTIDSFIFPFLFLLIIIFYEV